MSVNDVAKVYIKASKVVKGMLYIDLKIEDNNVTFDAVTFMSNYHIISLEGSLNNLRSNLYAVGLVPRILNHEYLQGNTGERLKGIIESVEEANINRVQGGTYWDYPFTIPIAGDGADEDSQ